MSKNCPQCGKVVYFAERAEKDGKTFHGPCLQKYLKEQGKGAKANHPFHSYTDAQREAAPNQQAGKTTIYTTQGPEIVSTK